MHHKQLSANYLVSHSQMISDKGYSNIFQYDVLGRLVHEGLLQGGTSWKILAQKPLVFNHMHSI